MTTSNGAPSRSKLQANPNIASESPTDQSHSSRLKLSKMMMSISKSSVAAFAAQMYTLSPAVGAGPVHRYVGHEVIGAGIKVGPNCVKVGDRVGVGAQIWLCVKCEMCISDNENYCPHQVGMSILIITKTT